MAVFVFIGLVLLRLAIWATGLWLFANGIVVVSQDGASFWPVVGIIVGAGLYRLGAFIKS